MNLVISHTSALEYLRTQRLKTEGLKPEVYTKNAFLEAPQAAQLHTTLFDPLSRPVHVLVSKSEYRRKYANLKTHLIKASLPKGAILDSGRGFFVSSPELCFVQMANLFELPELINLGFEFCGTYDISSGHYRSCEPLSSVEKLAVFCEKATFMCGVDKARRALRYVANRSASPMETILTMLLCLPYKMGGYGFELPEMNHTVWLDAKARLIAGKKICRCDLYWSGKRLAVEYDGKIYHESAEKMFLDSSRRDALISMGLTVITVTKWQIKDGGAFNGVAHTVARKLGKRLRYKDPEFTHRFLELQQRLLNNISKSKTE